MHYESILTNDNINLHFQTSLPLRPSRDSPESASAPGSDISNVESKSARTNPLAGTCVLLMHGFSGSSEYFTRNFASLASQTWVVAPDMRGHGHGASQSSGAGGYHVARLAADLHTIVKFIRSVRQDVRIYPVGCSIGAAVLWTYIELFGNTIPTHDTAAFAKAVEGGDAIEPDKMLNGMIFVDQAPLQDRTTFGDWDETRAHYSLYDEACLLEAQKAWANPDAGLRAEAHRDLVRSCLGYRFRPDNSNNQVSPQQAQSDEEFFTSISACCDGTWLSRLMADHTRYDHREALEVVDVPVLIIAGAQSGCFPIDGMLETVRRVNKNKDIELAKASIFDCGHWLFYEDPKRFNREVLEFVQHCEQRQAQ